MFWITNKVLTQCRALLLLGFLFVGALSVYSQSSLQDHPTPITRNEVSGTIKPRDLGDARLTTHYFWFEGSQGDVFINLTSKNFAGDIDVFTQNGLRTLTKIIVYADFGEVETGRVIYLRKSERLLLRVQGRSPNDEPANYRFKFAGSFVAAIGDASDVPEMPKVSESAVSGVRVNSAGTKLPPEPKPVEKKVEAETERSDVTVTQNVEPTKTEEVEKKTESVDDESAKKEETKPEVVVTDPVKEAATSTTKPAAKRPPRRTRATRTNPPKAEAKKTTEDAAPSNAEVSTKSEETTERVEAGKSSAKAEKPPDPLASIHLVILFKNGSKIERPLSEVLRFSVDKGILTVISKNGTTGKYQMLEVTKVTIE